MSTETSSATTPAAPDAAAPAAAPAAPTRQPRQFNRGPNRGGGGGPRRDNRSRDNKDQGDGPQMIENVVIINRCANVVK